LLIMKNGVKPGAKLLAKKIFHIIFSPIKRELL